jgi:hypothetical protein
VNTINPAVCMYDLKTKKYQILSEDENNRDFNVVGHRIFYENDQRVHSLIFKNGRFEKEKIPHQLTGFNMMYPTNGHLILKKGNEKDGRKVSVSFEMIDLTRVKP